MDKKSYDKTKYPNIWKHKTNGTYAIDLNLGYDSDGRRIRTTKINIKTEREAKTLLEDSLFKNQKKITIMNNSKFKDYIEEYWNWMEFSKKLKPDTINQKKGIFKIHVLPIFENKKIYNINIADIQNWHKYLNNYRKSNGDPLDSESKNNIHKKLSSYFNYLINVKGFKISNPCLSVENFKIEKKDIAYYNIDEFNKIIEMIDNDEVKSEETRLLIKAFLYAMFFTGMRPGEMYAIKPQNFSFNPIKEDINNLTADEVEYEITDTLYYGKGGWHESDGKTYDSLRKVFFPKKVFTQIYNYIKCMQNNGFIFKNDGYIFTNPLTEQVYCPEHIRKIINEYIDEAKIKKIKIKDLRHSCATLLNSMGYRLEDIKEQLGHTSIKTTEKFYASLYDENKKSMARNMNKLIK